MMLTWYIRRRKQQQQQFVSTFYKTAKLLGIQKIIAASILLAGGIQAEVQANQPAMQALHYRLLLLCTLKALLEALLLPWDSNSSFHFIPFDLQLHVTADQMECHISECDFWIDRFVIFTGNAFVCLFAHVQCIFFVRSLKGAGLLFTIAIHFHAEL